MLFRRRSSVDSLSTTESTVSSNTGKKFFRRRSSVDSTEGVNIVKKQSSKHHKKKRVTFKDSETEHHTYEFDWDYFDDYFYSKEEVKSFSEHRYDEADILRKERGIRTSSRNDAEGIEGDSRDHFIGDALTHALDDDNDAHGVSLRGIEHFVWPVLQKEMVTRKKQVRKVVAEWSIPKNRRKDPKGLKLAEEVAELSKWARDVASERGIKYCEMKRGGGLLRNSWTGHKENRRTLSGLLTSSFSKRDVFQNFDMKGIGGIYGD
jgi:hypothetical protein